MARPDIDDDLYEDIRAVCKKKLADLDEARERVATIMAGLPQTPTFSGPAGGRGSKLSPTQLPKRRYRKRRAHIK